MPRIKSEIVVSEVEKRIFTIRGQKVILDADLARIYGVKTKVLNQAVRRNSKRFPDDFMFRLTHEELKNLNSESPSTKSQPTGVMRSQFVTASKRNIRFLPLAFTEHGALMAANVLNSGTAVTLSIYVIRAFLRMRQVLTANQILEKRLMEIEKTLLNHDAALRDLYQRIRPLLLPPPGPKRRRIGFGSGSS
jgi:ORF6N domain